MRYDLFLFDLDDTLLDFRASQKQSFAITMQELGIASSPALYDDYHRINEQLWRQFEAGKVSKEHLKTARFRQLFDAHGVEMDPERASQCYLETLPRTVVLMDQAQQVCEYLSGKGEIGIITNGIHAVQTQRIANSALAPYVSFICVSEACGYAKPDIRFFEHGSAMAKRFSKPSSIVIGDRLEADIQGAQNFGVDSIWFNPARGERAHVASPTHEIHQLAELRQLL